MKSLYDMLMKLDYQETDEKQKTIRACLNVAERFYAQNVANYHYETDDQIEWDLMTDFPNLAPPFDVFWIEYRLPEKIKIGKSIQEIEFPGTPLGFLFISEKSTSTISDFKWEIFILAFIEYKGSVLEFPISWTIWITKDGYVCTKVPGIPDGLGFGTHVQKNLYDIASERIIKEGRGFGLEILVPALLTVSFLHCKNVQVIPRRPKIGNKSRRNRTGPKYEFHILEIEPMKKILREEGNAEKTGLKRALHICRGHFKDYRDGRGLFGKYKDIYFWDSQVRGSLEKGIVFKDYNVNEPKGTTEDGS